MKEEIGAKRSDSGGTGADELLRAYLAAHREPCPSCGYELHQLTGGKCPECGQALCLRVGLETPNLAAFVTGLVGLAAGFGFSGTVLLLLIYIELIEQFGPPFSIWVVLAVESSVSLGLILLWIRFGNAIRRMARGRRWPLAIACGALPIVNMIVYVIFAE